MRRASVVVVVGIAVTVTIGLRAYSTYARWSSSSVGFYVNPQNADVSESAALTALLFGAEAWETQSSAFFDVMYNGQVGDTTTGYDNRNVVIFRNQSNGNAIATTYSWYSGNTLLDADIVFWDGGHKFLTGSSGCSSGAFIEDIAAHEFGHALGLNHTPIFGATMYPSYKSCSQELRTLAADDIAGIEWLYPPATTNTAPTVAISSPVAGATFATDQAISFTGSANDEQDGNVSSVLTWTSSVDGKIGTGGSFSRTLSAGTHVITAAVSDTGGLSGSSGLSIIVAAPVLSATVYNSRTQKGVGLSWSGFSSSSVDIYRNGTLLLTTPNDGSHLDTPTPTRNGSGFTYVACAAGTSICSNQATVQL